MTLFHLMSWIQTQARLLRREEGQDLTEYALLLALIAVICIAGVAFLGTQISTILSELGSALSAQL
ncbi:MAG: Flp family type IVb pilin [Anaerolineae bacterium]